MPERITLIPLKERVKWLEQTYYAVQKELGMTLLSIDVGNYRELVLVKIREKTDSLIRKLNTMVYKWAKETVPVAYRKSYNIAKTRLEILGAKKDVFYNTNEHDMAVDAYSEAVIDDLIKANMSIRNTVSSYLHFSRVAHFGLMQIQQFDPGDEEIISDIIMDTIETGQTRTYASKRIYEYLRLQLLDGKFIDRNGRHYNLKDYSKMVARTRLRQAQTDAVKNTCKQYQNDLVQWSSHADSCPICAPFEGQVYSLSGQHPRYPLLDAEPPLHPNCEHDISPTSEVAIEYREANI